MTTAAPWMSASLAALVGIPSSRVSVAARSNRSHSRSRRWSTALPGPLTVLKCGADSTTPPRTIPGNPTEARAAAGSGATRRFSDATSLSGGSG